MKKDERISEEIYTVIDEVTTEFPEIGYRVAENGESLVGIVIDSPTGNDYLQVALWMCGDDLSASFGPWHTHVSHDKRVSEDGYVNETIADIVKAIIRDEFVVCEDVGGEYSGHKGGLDLRYKEAILEEITSKYSPGHVRISSWGGTQDGDYSLEKHRGIGGSNVAT